MSVVVVYVLTYCLGDKVMTTKASQVFAESFSIIHETPNPQPVVLLIITDSLASEPFIL